MVGSRDRPGWLGGATLSVIDRTRERFESRHKLKGALVDRLTSAGEVGHHALKGVSGSSEILLREGGIRLEEGARRSKVANELGSSRLRRALPLAQLRTQVRDVLTIASMFLKTASKSIPISPAMMLPLCPSYGTRMSPDPSDWGGRHPSVKCPDGTVLSCVRLLEP